MVRLEITSSLENIRKYIISGTKGSLLFLDNQNKDLSINTIIYTRSRKTYIKVTFRTALKQLGKIICKDSLNLSVSLVESRVLTK